MTKFSRMHYQKIAEVIAKAENSKYDVALKLAEVFQADNERFSFSKFAKASGITI